MYPVDVMYANKCFLHVQIHLLLREEHARYRSVVKHTVWRTVDFVLKNTTEDMAILVLGLMDVHFDIIVWQTVDFAYSLVIGKLCPEEYK